MSLLSVPVISDFIMLGVFAIQALLILFLLLERRKGRRAAAALDDRLRFETLVSDLSADFASLPSRLVDRKIQDWLQRLVEFLGVDRGAFLQFSEDGEIIHTTHRYVTPESDFMTSTTTKAVSREKIPWYVGQLRRGGTLNCPNWLEELPPEAVEEKEYGRRIGIKSHLAIPISFGGSVLCALAFTTVRFSRSWPADLIARLHLIGEIFANAVARRDNELALRKSEERYRAFVENSSEAIWRIDCWRPISINSPEDEQIEHLYGFCYLAECNNEMARMYGFSRIDEALGLRLNDVLPRSKSENIDYLRAFIRSGYSVTDAESVVITQQGEIKRFLNNLVGMVENGYILGIWGTNRDITERKRAEEALKLSEERFSKAFRSSPNAIVIGRKSDTRIIDVNDGWEELFGYTREDSVGHTPAELGMHIDEDNCRHLWHIANSEGSVRNFELALRTRSGEVRHTTLSAESIFIGGETCFITIIHDITERKKAEETLRKLTARLLELQDEERRRIASELHDSLGQSLVIIKNRAMIALRAHTDQEGIKEQLEEICSTAALSIDEVREIAHNLRPYELDRLGLVEAIESMINKVSDSTPIRFSADLDRIDGLFPPEAETGIYRIVQEGLNNVVRHAEASDARVSIKKIGSEVIITVQDNGKGIETRTAAVNGKSSPGFGLAGISERARMLGGTHLIKSKPGCGTTLTVRLGFLGGNNGR